MATLIEALRGRMESVAAPAQTSPLAAPTQTEDLGKLLAARGGKVGAASPTTPRASNLGEQAAVADTQAQLGQVAAQASGAAAELGVRADAQRISANQQFAEMDEARTAKMEEFAQRGASLMQELEFGERELDLRRDTSAAEQLGFYTRLANEKYITELNQMAQEKMLNEAQAYDVATSEAVFGEEYDLLKQKLGHADILNMDENEFRMQVGQLDLDFAMDIAAADTQAKNQAAVWTSVGGLASAGVQGYGAYEDGAFDSDYQQYRDEGGTSSYSAFRDGKSG